MPQPNNAPAKKHSLVGILGKPQFTRVTTAKIYGDEGGDRQRKLATVIVPFAGCDVVGVRGAMWVVQSGNSKPKAIFKFFGAQMQTSITPLDSQNPAALAAIAEVRDHIAAEYREWLKTTGTSTEGVSTANASGVEIDGLSL